VIAGNVTVFVKRCTKSQLGNMVRLRDARPRKVAVSVRFDAQVLNWLRSKGEGHLTRINDILTNLMEAEGGGPVGRPAAAFRKNPRERSPIASEVSGVSWERSVLRR